MMALMMNFPGGPGPRFTCLVGTVNLNEFARPPRPGAVLGTITLPAGETVCFVQTRPLPAGSALPADVNKALATVCGTLTAGGSQPTIDLGFITPGNSLISPGPGPAAGTGVLLLLLLALLARPSVFNPAGLAF